MVLQGKVPGGAGTRRSNVCFPSHPVHTDATIHWFNTLFKIHVAWLHVVIKMTLILKSGDRQKSKRGFWRTLLLLNSAEGRFFLSEWRDTDHRGPCCVLHSVPLSRTTVARLRNHGNTSFYSILVLNNWFQVWDLYKRGDKNGRKRMKWKKTLQREGKEFFLTFTNVGSSYKSSGLNKFQ